MGERVTTRNAGGYRVSASNGTSTIVLDATKADGGEAQGLSPHETLLAALGACTSMTLAIYARRKQWPLEGVELTLERTPPPVGAGDVPERVAVDVRLLGPLDAAQRAKLLEIAQKCPVYRTLRSEIAIEERLAS